MISDEKEFAPEVVGVIVDEDVVLVDDDDEEVDEDTDGGSVAACSEAM